MELLRNFKNLGKNDVSIAGGKGASLGEMTRLGISVPSGFVILSSAFDRFIEEAKLTAEIDAAIDSVDHRKIHTAENASEKIRSLILAAEMPKDITAEIKAAFKNLGAKNVAVRSSATAEDSSSAAWAGQLESYLNTTEKNLLDNVKRCWASLFTPRAIFYRFEKKMHKQKIGVAVVVQKMIASEISGVAFSVHPIAQDRNQIIIEASYGLGEAIVSGEITPDSYVIEKEPRQIIDRAIQNKRKGAVLSDRQILGLSALVLRIEKHYGFPCDIEWAIKNGKFYILQSRPITTLASGIKKISVPKKKAFITYENPIYPYFYSPTMYAAVPKYKGRHLMGDWYAKFRYKNTSIIKAPEKAFEEYGDFYLNLILKRNKALCDHLFSLGKKIVALGEKLQARNYDDLKLGKVSNVGAFYKEYRNTFGEVLGFGYSLDYALDHYIKENNIDLHSIAASYPSFIQLEKYQLKKIFQNKKGVALDTAIREHALRYSWLQNDYSGEYRISIEDIAAKRAATLNEKSNVKSRKIAKPKNVKEWISFLTFIRDERKKCNLIATGLLDRYLKKECSARGIDYVRAVMLTVDEFEKSKNRNIKNYKGVRTVHITKDGVDDLSQKTWDTAVDEGKWIGDENEFSGISAMSGVAVGVAKVILQRSDFPKLKQGEIIVTSMTRPEFSPILGKCSGIITNEGGVTSHAAIIARELKKPCVIGTSVATKLIHDGDTVRVNGDNGTITIIKKLIPKTMCGILGIVSQNELDETKFSAALEKSKHRGPDGSQVQKINDNCLFGFNWLSIQDLRIEAMQPFHYGDNWLVFNGEIYNFVELREDLKKQGYEFRTTSDTEVLIAGLTHKGVDFLQDINGIFAFCFYDAKKKEYLVVRDRVGVKPLFYHQDDEQFIFSSEVKSILDYVPATLDIAMLHTHLFLDRFVGHQKSKSFFRDISSLEPGYYLILDAVGRLKTKNAYYRPDFKTSITGDISKMEHDFSILADQAVHWETRSDVPIGVVLSGGIDSTAVMTLAAPYLIEKEKHIPTFTYYFKQRGEQTDLEYAQKLVGVLSEKYGSEIFEMHALNLDDAFTLEDFTEATLAREQPVFDIRYITKMKNYKSVRAGNLKVCFNGQGADEVFYGYYPLDYWMSIFYREGTFDTDNIIRYFEGLNKLKFSGLAEEFLKEAEGESRTYVDSVFHDIGAQENQPKLVTAFIRENMLPTMLGDEDKLGMHSGLEVRVPMVNRLLVEYADQCDYKVHIASTTSGRHLFRKMLEDKLPDEIVYRTKSPGPKKNYTEELLNIINQHKAEMLRSSLLGKIYREGFIENLANDNTARLQTEQFYGNINDVLVEIIGLFAFEKVYNASLI